MTNNMPRDPESDSHIKWLYKQGKDKQDIIRSPIFYMVEATYYDPREETRLEHNGYVENAFCESADSSRFSTQASLEQTEALRDLMISLDCSIILGPGRAGQFDGVFTRDAGFTMMDVTQDDQGNIQHAKLRTLSANFHHIKREDQREVDDYMAAVSFLYHHLNEDFAGNNIGISMHQSHLDRNDPVGEFGDFMYVPSKDIFVAGYRPEHAKAPEDGRTDKVFHDIVARAFNVQGRILPIEVSNGFFHADTSVKWLPNGFAIAHENGMSPQSFNHLKKAVGGSDNLILTSKADACAYAPNTLVVDEHNIIMPEEVSTKLIKTIEKTGIKVHTTPLSQFTEQSGGGANCLTNKINNFRVPNDDFHLPAHD